VEFIGVSDQGAGRDGRAGGPGRGRGMRQNGLVQAS
jgi:hypothetical protein